MHTAPRLENATNDNIDDAAVAAFVTLGVKEHERLQQSGKLPPDTGVQEYLSDVDEPSYITESAQCTHACIPNM
jgi:hypothetical protein